MSRFATRACAYACSVVVAPIVVARAYSERETNSSTVEVENELAPRAAVSHDERSRTRWRYDWNPVNEEVKGGASKQPTRVVWLVRHGQAEPENGDVEDGARRLTSLGLEQSKRTALRLKMLIESGSVDGDFAGSTPSVMIHSSMTRARETADVIAESAFPHVRREVSHLIREGAPCRPEPDTWNQKEEVHQSESPRIEAGFRSIFHRAAADQRNRPSGEAAEPPSVVHEIFVCHGNVIRYSVLRALQLPPDAWLRIGLYNASITRVDVHPSGRVSLRSLGDAGHLPTEALTWN